MANVNYQARATGKDHCQECRFMDLTTGVCGNAAVAEDPAVPVNAAGQKYVAPLGWCAEFAARVATLPTPVPDVKAAATTYRKGAFFAKVDEAKREVWGIVTAQVPDKDDEVCDYAKSKVFYQQVIAEMSKATDGANFFPLRYMHQLDAIGKCVGYDFRDADREIFMGFKVTSDEKWNMVVEKVLTGFSHGGAVVGPMVPDPEFEGCRRYVAKPSEVSLVDNPCLGVAHITWIRANGAVELVKVGGGVAAQTVERSRLAALERDVALLKAGRPVAKVETKRVGGKDLSASAFAYVGDAKKTETWKLPIHDAAHARNALARFGQTQGIPAGERARVHARIVAAAKRFGVEVAAEQAKAAAIADHLRKLCRARVNRLVRTSHRLGIEKLVAGRDARPIEIANLDALLRLDGELGKLAKGMREVSQLAAFVDGLSWLLYSVCAEQEWEKDESSPLPAALAGNVEDLIDSLVAMVAEETDELRDAIGDRVAEVTATA